MPETKPFIVWSLQRTGGTNLARALFERSGLLERSRAANPGSPWLVDVVDQWKLHEPFNHGDDARVFGGVTDRWINTKDKDELRRALGDICQLHIPFKHCVEMLPSEFNQELARVSHAHGYAHVFLYRKQALNRLLSLHYAKQTGVWGPEMKGRAALNQRIFAAPLPVAELVSHEARCIQQLTAAWQFLKAQGAKPMAIAFEDIYEEGDSSRVEARTKGLLANLNISRSGADDKRFVKALIARGDQGTKADYASFQGLGQLQAQLSALKPFSPDADSNELEIEILPNSEIAFAKVDVVPLAVRPGQPFDLGGVLVLNMSREGISLEIQTSGGPLPVKWDISSPKMAKQFPDSPNSSHSRFKVSQLTIGVTQPTIELFLKRSNGIRTPVVRASLRGERLSPSPLLNETP